jgi:hypothetical protein
MLKLALLSLTESVRKDPSKYSFLIYHNNTSSTADCSGQYYSSDSYGQHQQQYPSHDYISVLLEESEKLYTSLKKEWVDEIITDYTPSITSSSSSSLPLLPPSEERQSHPTTTTTSAANHMHMHTE